MMRLRCHSGTKRGSQSCTLGPGRRGQVRHQVSSTIQVSSGAVSAGVSSTPGKLNIRATALPQLHQLKAHSACTGSTQCRAAFFDDVTKESAKTFLIFQTYRTRIHCIQKPVIQIHRMVGDKIVIVCAQIRHDYVLEIFVS